MRNLKILFFILSVGLFLNVNVFAADDSKSSLPFDKGVSYDVYFYSGEEGKCVVKEVEILRFEEIHGKSFIVVLPFGFKFNKSEGFVLFESVSAIIPHQDYQVNVNQPHKIHVQ